MEIEILGKRYWLDERGEWQGASKFLSILRAFEPLPRTGFLGNSDPEAHMVAVAKEYGGKIIGTPELRPEPEEELIY